MRLPVLASRWALIRAHRVLGGGLILLGLGSVTVCGGPAGPDPSDAIESVSVSPNPTSVDVASTTQLQATVRNGRNEVVSATVSWTTSAPTVATVSGSGLVTGVAEGVANITASAGGERGSATVTVNDPFPPMAPSNVQGVAISDTEVEVTWTDNSSNEDEFIIERETALPGSVSGDGSIGAVFVLVGTVGPDVTNFRDTGLEAATAYRYRVLGCNENGCSEPSAESTEVTTATEPTGTLTVRKTIVSSTGGTPDNPSTPSLSGFVFAIKRAGETEVVETVTTDANGETIATVPVGSYDVMETESQGLTDVTGAANAVAVSEGADTPVPWTNQQAAIPTGTITVRKTIVSSTGGTPDNPSTPSLSGFVFAIKRAGTTEVVETVTTDANGEATATVAVGSYDVMETDPQGLTDVTGAADAVAVSAGADTPVPWTNRQAPIPTGTLTVQKAIVSSMGGMADNPADPPLSGFVFVIKRTGTTEVVETVTTDGNGEGTATVPVGSYDVMETAPQGLMDVTGAANAVAVSEGTDTPVPWTNGQAPIPTGTLTVQKTIESSTGGMADNPPNPSLSGFVFAIKRAGTTEVVETVTTDTNGEATATVPVGFYDVTETDSQGLTDVTGPKNAIGVSEGTDTLVPWTNQQAAPVVVINVISFAFRDPDGSSTTTISKGTTIRWVAITGGHTVTPDGHSEWTSQSMSAGSVFEHTFGTTGTFDYFCIPHRGIGMTGQIIVQ